MRKWEVARIQWNSTQSSAVCWRNASLLCSCCLHGCSGPARCEHATRGRVCPASWDKARRRAARTAAAAAPLRPREQHAAPAQHGGSCAATAPWAFLRAAAGGLGKSRASRGQWARGRAARRGTGRPAIAPAPARPSEGSRRMCRETLLLHLSES